MLITQILRDLVQWAKSKNETCEYPPSSTVQNLAVAGGHFRDRGGSFDEVTALSGVSPGRAEKSTPKRASDFT
jgi:hypothetical protein